MSTIQLIVVIIPLFLITKLCPRYKLEEFKEIRYSVFTNSLVHFTNEWIHLPAWILLFAVLIGLLLGEYSYVNIYKNFNLIIIIIIIILVLLLIITYISILIENWIPPVRRFVIKRNIARGLKRNKEILKQ